MYSVALTAGARATTFANGIAPSLPLLQSTPCLHFRLPFRTRQTEPAPAIPIHTSLHIYSLALGIPYSNLHQSLPAIRTRSAIQQMQRLAA